MEQCFHFSKCHQWGLGTHRRGWVADQVCDRKLNLTFHNLATQAVIHPGASPFVGRTGIGVQVKAGDVFSGFICDVEITDVFIPDRYVFGDLGDCNAKDTIDQLKQPIQYFFQREIRSQFFIGIAESLFPQTLWPESEIPLNNGFGFTLRRGELLQFF